MIRIKLKPKPINFDNVVKNPGQDFLKQIPHPKGKQWDGKDYWCKVLPDMMELYDSICAYSSLWIKPDQPTVDHYISKNKEPSLAYEWKNFRLARWRINTRKGVKNIIDPFTVNDDWFVLDFTTFGINVNPILNSPEREIVKYAIDELKLDTMDYREAREAWFEAFKNDIVKLKRKAPFVAYEMQRQGIVI